MLISILNLHSTSYGNRKTPDIKPCIVFEAAELIRGIRVAAVVDIFCIRAGNLIATVIVIFSVRAIVWSNINVTMK